ncbi:MAG: Phosphoserine phosphatase RsbU [bacterium ADurb.Bin363]|nr:MAG: Phosphoserine phosphatase RsbU [bacterium ADurb.Bin363]
MALLLILNVINGWLAANTVGKAADKQMGDLLIKRSNTVVSSIDCERIKNLIKTHMEKENYEFLKNQIMNICVANPDFNFVYLLTRKEGKLIFLIDYISVGTYKSLKSDKIYQKSLTHIINSFTSDKTSVEGPSSDERGSWAESYSPIQDRETNQVIGVLVINTDVTEWKHIIAVNRLNPILITIIISILIIVFFIIHQKSLEVSFKIAAKEKERIEGELKIAHDIQMNMLPLLPLTESQSFRIYGFMEPAREVGGDFYDFFILDDKLCFIIGDVSDKGVPAALFMAVINSLYRYIASEGKSPSVVLEKLNKKVINNQSFMFVTAFCGMLDLKTGKLKYSNAGHNTPYIIKNNQKAKMMEKATTSVLGIKEEKYVDKELILEPGDYLFTYTDGVTEATGNEHELFGDERLKEILSARYYTSPEEMVGVVSGNVKEFSGNLEQSDDITMLVIKYMKGNQ